MHIIQTDALAGQLIGRILSELSYTHVPLDRVLQLDYTKQFKKHAQDLCEKSLKINLSNRQMLKSANILSNPDLERAIAKLTSKNLDDFPDFRKIINSSNELSLTEQQQLNDAFDNATFDIFKSFSNIFREICLELETQLLAEKSFFCIRIH